MTDTDTNKIALITGASRGLGAALAQALAARGHHIIAVARTIGALEELDDRIGGGATLVPLDLTNDEGVERLGAAIHDRWGRLDLLVHCAIHATPLSPAHLTDAKDLDTALRINARVTQRLIRMADPLLRAAPAGAAWFFEDRVNTGANHAAYQAGKAAQSAITRAWAAECARIGPQVRHFAPPAMPTALRARFHPGEDRAALTATDAAARDILEQAGV